MSSHKNPQLQGEASGGSSSAFPEGRTSFQSSSPRTVLPMQSASKSLKEDIVAVGNNPTETAENRGIELSQQDSINEEISFHLASKDDMKPAQTVSLDGRNVSLTKMLMSAKEFHSFSDSVTSDLDTALSSQESMTHGQRTLPPKISPSKENLRNIKADGTIPVEKQESVSHFDLPPGGLQPSSSVQIIEKHSAPGALSDVAYPYNTPSAVSTRSLKFPEQTISEFGMKKHSRLAKESSVCTNEGLEHDEDVNELQRLDSEYSIRTVHDESQTEDKQLVAESNESFDDSLSEREISSAKWEPESEHEQKGCKVSKNINDTATKSEKIDSRKSGGVNTPSVALERGSSVSEFQSAAALLHEKQRRLVEKKLTEIGGKKKEPKRSLKGNDHEGGTQTRPGYKLTNSSKPTKPLKEQPGERSTEIGISSELPDYTTPSKLLQKRQDRERGPEKCPGYGVIDYTTPSRLLEKHQQLKQKEDNIETPSNVLDYTTPSKLLQKRQDRERGQENSPGYCVFNYCTPSKLLKMQEEHKSEKDFLDYTTPSKLLKKHDECHKGQERSPGYGTLDYTTASKLLDSQNTEHDVQAVSKEDRNCVENHGDSSPVGPGDRELLNRIPSKQRGEHAVNSTVSDVTTYYFRRLSEILKSQIGFSHSFSDPELADRVDSDVSSQTLNSSVDCQRNPLPSAPLSLCNCGSADGKHFWNCGAVTKYEPVDMSKSTSKDTGFESGGESVSSLSYPDSLWSLRESRFEMTPNPSLDVVSNTGASEENIERPSTSLGSHSSLSTNEMFWYLYSANPGLAHQVLGPEFAVAMKALNRLYQGTSSLDSLSDSDPSLSAPHFPASQNSSSVDPTPLYSSKPASSSCKPSSLAQDDQFDTDDEWSRSEGQLRKSAGTRAASPDVRNFIVEKEKLESQMRKLQVENSTLHTENKLMKEKFNRATARISDLEQKLNESQDEMEALHSTMSAEISTLCDKARTESRTDMEQLKARVLSLTHHNQSLQSEIVHLGKQLEAAEHEVDSVRHSLDRSQAVGSFKSEILSLQNEVGHVKELLQQSEAQVKVEVERAREAHQQIIQLTEVRNLLQQQIDSGGIGTSIAEKQNLREMKVEYDTKMKEVEEKIEDIRSERIGFENEYKEQLTRLTKEKHEAWARLKTLEDMMDALRKENDTLRQGLASSEPESNIEKVTAEYDARVESLTLEIQTLESRAAHLQRGSQKLEVEIETLRTQLKAREDELEETKSELEIVKSRTSCDESDERRQEKIEQLTAQVNSLQEEVKSLSENQSKLRTEKSRLERQVEEATHQLALKSRAKDKSGSTVDAKVSLLESELARKESELIQVTSQFHDVEAQLQHTKQDLFFHQQQISDMQCQVESLEQQLVQRGQLLDTISGKEKEQLQQFQLVKDSLDAATNSLKLKTAEFKVVQAELTRERYRRQALEKQVQGEERSRDPDADVVAPGVRSALQIRLKELESLADKLRGELVDSASLLKCKEENLSAMRTELARTSDDLENEKNLMCQLASEKLILQQQLQAVVDDRNCLQEEKEQAEEDLVKLESKLQEVVHKFQMDTWRHHDNFNTNYSEPESSEGKEMLSELQSIRLLLEGKEKEVDVMNNRMSRQQMENGFLLRRVELLRQENQCHKEDIQRLSQQLITKMKEKSATAKLNQHLNQEKTTLEQDNHQLMRDLQREKDFTERQKAEVSEVIKKIEKSETSQRCTVNELHQREGDIASLETDLRQLGKEKVYLEAENQQLKSKLESQKEEVQRLISVNNSLNNRLDMERTSLVSEKSGHTKKKEELSSTQQKLEAVQREQSMLLNNLSSERKTVEQLRSELSSMESSEQNLREQLSVLQVSLDSQRGQCLALRNNLEEAKKEKTSIFHEYQDLCRQLGEKEKKVSNLVEQHERQVHAVKRESALQLSSLDQEKATLEKELEATKVEINELNEQLHQKDVQLKAFGRTLAELEDTVREKKSLEMKLEKLESAGGDSKMLLESQRSEIVALKEMNSSLQEKLTKVQINYLSVQEQLRSQSDTSSGQVVHLRLQMDELKNKQEGEKAHLREALSQAEANLRAAEATLKTTTEGKDQALSGMKTLEKSLDDTQRQLSEEVMARKLLEQRIESEKSHLENIKKKKQGLEERVAELQASASMREAELNLERNRVMTLTGKVHDLEAMTQGNQSAVRSKTEQVEILQNEVGKLQQLLDHQKQQLGGKYKKANLELKQQVESHEKERSKLSQEAQQLSVNLEQAREQVAVKNKENLKLQQDILLLEEQVRDNSSQLKQAQESLRIEEQMQNELNARFTAQEDELKRLRAFLAKKAEEGGDKEAKGMWQEMNRMIQGLSREMQQHMEGQQRTTTEARDREIKLANSYKKQITKLESTLNTERALHQITRNSAKALEEDNARMRQQLLLMRRKSQSPEKKLKNRSEEINELIARSQSRANAMLSSGSYLDGTFRNIKPTRDYNTNSVNQLDRSQSPDTTSQISDISFGSSSPVYLAFMNSSGNFPGSGNVTPRKSPH